MCAAFVAVLAVVALVVPSTASATPSDGSTSSSPSSGTPNDATGTAAAAPTDAAAIDVGNHIAKVQRRLDRLAKRNDQLVERFNQATIAYQKAKGIADVARAAALAAEHRLAVASQQFRATAASQYEGGSYSATGALLSSSSGSNYLDQLDTMTMLSAHNAQIVTNYTALQHSAATAKQQANAAYAAAGRQRRVLAARKSATKAQIAKYKTLLDSLNAQQRAIWARHAASVDNQKALDAIRPAVRSAFRNGFKTPQLDSAALVKVVAFALRQVGKPYVWGSGGPDSYDCSGLTMSAYARAGVHLPHSALQQYGFGHHVSFNQMQPGDLMFWYSPIGHVAMYIGGGMMVTAPQSGENVKVTSARDNASDFVGATRLIN